MIKNKYFVYDIIPTEKHLENMNGRWLAERMNSFIHAIVQKFGIDLQFYRPSKFLNTKISTLKPIDSSIIDQIKLEYPGIIFELCSVSNPAIDDAIDMLYEVKSKCVYFGEDGIVEIIDKTIKKIEKNSKSEGLELPKREYKECIK